MKRTCTYTRMMVILKGIALSCTVMSLLESGRHPITRSTISLCTRKSNPCSCFSSFLLKYTLLGFLQTFSISSHTIQGCSICIGPSHAKCSSTLPAALQRVLTFHVAMVMSSLPRSLAPVAHLSFPPLGSLPSQMVYC